MDINQKLWKRKIQKIHSKKNKALKLKRNFKKFKENEGYDHEKETFKNDVLFEKKKQFYKELFEGNEGGNVEEGNIEEGNIEEGNIEKIPKEKEEKNEKQKTKTEYFEKNKKPMTFSKQIKKINSENQKKEEELKTKNLEKQKEKKLLKGIFKQRTKKNQPIMKNYMNYLLYKIEKNMNK